MQYTTELKINKVFHALPIIAGLFVCALTAGENHAAMVNAQHEEFEHRVMYGISKHCMVDESGNVFDLGANVDVVKGEEYETCVWLGNNDFSEEIVDFCPIEEVLYSTEAVALGGGQLFCLTGIYAGEIYCVKENLQEYETYKLRLNTHWTEEIEDDSIYSYMDLETWELTKMEAAETEEF